MNGMGIASGDLPDTGSLAEPTLIEIDVTNNLKEGRVHNFALTVTDSVGTKKIITWTINFVQFTLTSKFDDMQHFGVGENIRYEANIYGAGFKKTVSVAYNN
jgi:hypothetical protein